MFDSGHEVEATPRPTIVLRNASMLLPPPHSTCPRCFHFHHDRMGILNNDLTVLRRTNRASSTRIASHSLVELSRPALAGIGQRLLRKEGNLSTGDELPLEVCNIRQSLQPYRATLCRNPVMATLGFNKVVRHICCASDACHCHQPHCICMHETLLFPPEQPPSFLDITLQPRENRSPPPPPSCSFRSIYNSIEDKRSKAGLNFSALLTGARFAEPRTQSPFYYTIKCAW